MEQPRAAHPEQTHERGHEENARHLASAYRDWMAAFGFDPTSAQFAIWLQDRYGIATAAGGPLSDEQLEWAQDHVAILSGLYGVLRPLDLMLPYRLEMGTRLATAHGQNLYDYWGSSIAQYLNKCLAKQADPVLLNLASEEYFKSVDLKTLKAKVVQCVFQDQKNGAWKVISFYAKRARGLMARYAIQHRIGTPAGLQDFAVDGYAYAPEASEPDRLVFRRRVAD